MKTVINRILNKKVLAYCLILLPLFFLTGCSNLITPEAIEKIAKYGTKAGGAGAGLGVISSAAESATQCWPCSVFIVTWNAIGEAFEQTIGDVTYAARLMLGVGLLFWLTFTIGKLVTQLKEPNMKDFIPLIAGTLFKAICVGIILSSPSFVVTIINFFMDPILKATIYVSKLVLPNDLELESTLLSILNFIANPLSSLTGLFEERVSNHIVFTKDIGEALRDVLYSLYDTFKGGFILGGKMMFQVDIMAIASGGLILATFFYFMFYFPLLLLEGFITLGVVLILFPVFLAGWVFPSTKGYINEVIKIIFQSVAQILITSIYIGVIIAIIQANQDMFSITKMLTDPILITGIGNMNNNGLAFFGMIFCLLKLTNDIPNITSYFVGEMNKSIIARSFSKMQKLMASSAKMVVGASMAGTGVLGAVGKAMVAQGGREAIQEGTDISTNDTQKTNADVKAETGGH